MLKLLNKIISSIKKNRNKILSLMVLGFLLLLTPVQRVRADFWSDLLNVFSNIITLPLKIGMIVGIIMTMVPLLVQGIMTFVIYLITVLISRAMIVYSLNVPISPSSQNAATIDIIVRSWSFVLGFVNMFFALTLTFIGLATILRLKDYEAKKLLPKLLIIAILVNFTPVIIGFIVDMGNLVTNFFVSKSNISGDTISESPGDFEAVFLTTLNLNAIGSFFSNLLSLIMGPFINVLSAAINLIGGMIIGIIFLMYAIYVYICVTGIFFLRFVMLWILTILSPIAFFSYIFPEGSPFQRLFPDILHWKKWWEEFLKWVIVGIPFGLFLYVSTAIFIAGDSAVPQMGSGTISPTQGVDVQTILDNITQFFTYFVAIMMLHQGYKISTAAAPKMAQQMIKGTEKLIKTAAMAVATMGVGAAAGAAAGSMGSMASGLGGTGAKLAAKGGIRGTIGKGMGGLSKVMRKGQTRLTQTAIKNKPKVMSGFSEMNAGQQLDATKGMFNKRSRMEHYSKMDWSKVSEEDKEKMIPEIEGMMKKENLRGEYSDTFRKMSKAGISSEAIRMGLNDDSEEAKQAIDNKTKEIKDNMSEDDQLKKEIEVEIITKYGTGASEKDKEQFKRDLAAQALNFEELSPGDLKDLGKNNITSLSARLGSHKLSGNSLKNIRNNYGDTVTDKLFNGAGGINKTFAGKDGYKQLMEKNGKLARYLLTNTEGTTFGWNQLENQDILDNGEVNYKKVKDGYEKYKKEEGAKIATTSIAQEIEIDSAEIASHAKKIKDERISRANDPSYQYNGKFVDQLLKNVGITKETPEAEAFMKKWDKTRATKQLTARKQAVNKAKDLAEAIKKNDINNASITSQIAHNKQSRTNSPQNSEERKAVQALLLSLGFDASSTEGKDAIRQYDQSKASEQLIKRIITTKEPYSGGLKISEIDKKAKEIKQKRIANDPSYQYNGKFVDQLLKNVGITKETPEAEAFMKKWDKTKAIETLQKARLKKRGISQDLLKNLSRLQATKVKKRNKVINQQIQKIQGTIKEVKEITTKIQEMRVKDDGTQEWKDEIKKLESKTKNIQQETEKYEKKISEKELEIKKITSAMSQGNP